MEPWLTGCLDCPSRVGGWEKISGRVDVMRSSFGGLPNLHTHTISTDYEQRNSDIIWGEVTSPGLWPPVNGRWVTLIGDHIFHDGDVTQ